MSEQRITDMYADMEKRALKAEAQLEQARECIYVLEETLGSEDDSESWISLKRRAGQYREALEEIKRRGVMQYDGTIIDRALSETPPSACVHHYKMIRGGMECQKCGDKLRAGGSE